MATARISDTFTSVYLVIAGLWWTS